MGRATSMQLACAGVQTGISVKIRNPEQNGQTVRREHCQCLTLSALLVQIQVQLQHIHSGFAEQSQIALVRVFLNQTPNNTLSKAALTRYPWNLKLGSGRRDFRVQTGSGSGEKVDGDRLIRVLLMKGRRIGAHSLDQFLVRRAVVRTT